jgi:hypothetical protein
MHQSLCHYPIQFTSFGLEEYRNLLATSLRDDLATFLVEFGPSFSTQVCSIDLMLQIRVETVEKWGEKSAEYDSFNWIDPDLPAVVGGVGE